jgi:hypothetical protein
MKFILRLILITAGCYFIPFYAPWWIIFVITGLVGYLIPGNGFVVFNAGFLGGGLVWLGYAFKLDVETQSIKSEKLVQLFPVSDPTYLIIAAGVTGAFSAGFGALTGNSFRQIFIKKKQKSLYS